MKNSISKVALLLLCSVFAFSSCTKENKVVPKKTATMQYRILVNGAMNYTIGAEKGGIDELYSYMKKEMAAVSTANDKAMWTITEEAETEEAALAACDKKAIAVFDEKLAAMNAATESIKTKFDAKKTELSAKIAIEASTAHFICKNYGGILYKGKAGDGIPTTVVKSGKTVDMEATGGKK